VGAVLVRAVAVLATMVAVLVRVVTEVLVLQPQPTLAAVVAVRETERSSQAEQESSQSGTLSNRKIDTRSKTPKQGPMTNFSSQFGSLAFGVDIEGPSPRLTSSLTSLEARPHVGSVTLDGC
jgi:hypothetical protein